MQVSKAQCVPRAFFMAISSNTSDQMAATEVDLTNVHFNRMLF